MNTYLFTCKVLLYALAGLVVPSRPDNSHHVLGKRYFSGLFMFRIPLRIKAISK
jgi:hypothetical protein